MCGVFGFITKDGRGPNLNCLRRIAVETQTRGHHAFGLAWADVGGRLHTYKGPGPATAALEDLDRVRNAVIVIGHCRWATHGSPLDNRNNHPHRAGRGVLVHNGVVFNRNWLIRQYRLAPRTQCDSEILGLLLARMAGPIDLRAARTAQAADGPLAILGIWTKPARLWVVRRGKPLWFGESRGGSYFGSLAAELPEPALPVEDRYSGVLAVRSGGVHEQGPFAGDNGHGSHRLATGRRCGRGGWNAAPPAPAATRAKRRDDTRISTDNNVQLQP